MYTATSELQQAQLSKVTSPVLKVTMRSNYLQGASQAAFIQFSDISDLQVFNNQIIASGRSASQLGVRTYSVDGSNMLSNINLNAGNSYNAMDLVTNGNTLLLYYAINGLTPSIYRIASNNGTTWGGTQLLAVSTKSIISIAATGSSRFYTLNTSGTTSITPYPLKDLSQIVIYSQVGSTFLGVTSYLSNFFGKRIHIEESLSQKDIESGIVIGSRETSGDNIYTFRSDGSNIFNFNPLYVDPTGQVLTLNAVNLTKGSSRYFFSLSPSLGVVNDEGASILYTVNLGQGYMSSIDLANWSNIKFMGETFISSLGVVTGISGVELAMLGVSGTASYKIYNGVSELDISDYITAYSNTDNSRVNLTLGNYHV